VKETGAVTFRGDLSRIIIFKIDRVIIHYCAACVYFLRYIFVYAWCRFDAVVIEYIPREEVRCDIPHNGHVNKRLFYYEKKEKRLIIGFLMNVVTDVCNNGTKDGCGFSGLW